MTTYAPEQVAYQEQPQQLAPQPNGYAPPYLPLTTVIHGESGAGKSWLADTCPAPRLILDAEGGSRWTPSQPKIVWSPYENPPAYDGSWQTTVCYVRDFPTMQRVYQWLNSGQHPWVSCSMDSLTEIQKRCGDAIAGTNQLTQQDWGQLLRDMESLVRQYRDLTFHPTRPLLSVNFVTLTDNDKGVMRPSVQGRLRTTLPGFVDVVGYLYTVVNGAGQLERQMLTQPAPGYLAKDRTNRLPMVVNEPNLSRMMEVINGR
jgi:hypothetical protein